MRISSRPQASWADGLYEAVCPACLWPLGYPQELSYVYSEHKHLKEVKGGQLVKGRQRLIFFQKAFQRGMLHDDNFIEQNKNYQAVWPLWPAWLL